MKFAIFWSREAPRCHPRGPGPIKDEISHQKYLHVFTLKGLNMPLRAFPNSCHRPWLSKFEIKKNIAKRRNKTEL